MKTSSRGLATLTPLVAEIERVLADYYGFVPRLVASDHMLSRDELVQALGEHVKGRPEFSAPGAVWFVPDGQDAAFLGIHFCESIAARIEQDDPLFALSDSNLEAFCVLVEEVSHFHLITNRASEGRPVTKTELEWQGEVDKLLVSGLLLEKQCGNAHLEALARRLYDMATIVADDHDVYWEATRYAAQFWYRVLAATGRLTEIRRELQERYLDSWQDKKNALASPTLRRAS